MKLLNFQLTKNSLRTSDQNTKQEQMKHQFASAFTATPNDSKAMFPYLRKNKN